MSSAEIKRFVFATTVLVALILLALVWIVDSMIFGLETLSRLPLAATITAVLWGVYFRWGWKWWPFAYLFKRPRIDGTWVGHLESDWVKNGTNATSLIPIAFVINQTFFSLTLRSFTGAREGISDVASLVVKPEAEIVYVSYIYGLRQEFVAGAGEQQGAGELRLVDKSMELKGQYWTNTKTSGRVRVQRKTRKRFSSFGEVEKVYPVSSWPKFNF